MVDSGQVDMQAVPQRFEVALVAIAVLGVGILASCRTAGQSRSSRRATCPTLVEHELGRWLKPHVIVEG